MRQGTIYSRRRDSGLVWRVVKPDLISARAGWNETMRDSFACLIWGVEDESEIDSGIWPQACETSAEADTPQHCDNCGLFLKNKLTRAGEEYVRDEVDLFDLSPKKESQFTQDAVDTIGEWKEFYSYLFEEK